MAWGAASRAARRGAQRAALLQRLQQQQQQRRAASSGAAKPAASAQHLKAAAAGGAPGAAGAGGQGGGAAGRLLLLGALVAPPVAVAYLTRTDPEFRKSFKAAWPALYETVADAVLPPGGLPKLDGLEVEALKQELEELAARWERSGSHSATFSKDEVSAMKSKLEAAQEKVKAAGEQAAKAADKAAAKAGDKATKAAEAPAPGGRDARESAPAAEEPAASPAPAAEAEETEEDVRAVVAPARGKLDALRDKVRRVKARADRDTDSQIKQIEKELRADLEVVLAHDLSHLDEDGLRQRVVQLVLELKDRNRWEALRMHELTKRHTEDLVRKYDGLLQEQADRYEELVRYESAAAAQRAAEQTQQLTEDHFNRVLVNKEQQWHLNAQQTLDRQRAEMAKELEHRVASTKSQLETRSAEEMNSRLAALNSLKSKVHELQQALANRSEADKNVTRVRDLSLAAIELQHALYRDPATVGSYLARIEQSAGSDPVLRAALSSIPQRVRKNGVPSEIELAQRFDTVYDSCYQASLVPEDASILEHAAARLAATLTIGGVEEGEDAGPASPKARLGRARSLLFDKADLPAAVKELDGLRGVVKETASDWVNAAKDRIAVEQALLLVKSRIASLRVE